MAFTADLTIRETVALSGVPRTTVEKALETGVLPTVNGLPRLRGGATRYLPLRAVVYFRALKAANLVDLPLRHKQQLWSRLVKLEPLRLEPVEFAPGTTLDLSLLASDTLRIAERYKKARDKYIRFDPNILGGTPIIAGTRLTVYAVLGRLQGGDEIGDWVEDYPEIPLEAFDAAVIFAKAHPLRGKPSGRPWQKLPD